MAQASQIRPHVLAAETVDGGDAGLRRMRHPRRNAVLALSVAVCLSGCAGASALHRGETAERVQDFDRAVVEYTNAVRLNPNSPEARLALDRAKLRSAGEHFTRG